MLRCVFGPNLVILAWTAGELWCEQAQNEVKFYFQVKFDLEGHGRSSPKTIGTQTKVFCISGPNLVILACMSDELSCGQASDWHTHGHTDPQTQPMTIPEGQNWPRVKITPGIPGWLDELQWLDLTLNMRRPSYLGLTRSISWLLMAWLLASPGHQQQ